MKERAEWGDSPMGRSSMIDVGSIHVEVWQSAVMLKWFWSARGESRFQNGPHDSMQDAKADAVHWLRKTIAEMAAACPEVE